MWKFSTLLPRGRVSDCFFTLEVVWGWNKLTFRPKKVCIEILVF